MDKPGDWQRCWRCGEIAQWIGPYYLCMPCVEVVSDEDIAWVEDPTNQPGKTTYDMAPLGKPQGR